MNLKIMFSAPQGIPNDEKHLSLLEKFYRQGQKLPNAKQSKAELSTQLNQEVQEALTLDSTFLWVKTPQGETVFEII